MPMCLKDLSVICDTLQDKEPEFRFTPARIIERNFGGFRQFNTWCKTIKGQLDACN
jgi:hypothetical protein